MNEDEVYKRVTDIIESVDALATAGDHRHLFMLALCCGVARVIAESPDAENARQRAVELIGALVGEYTAGRPRRARVFEFQASKE